MSNGFTLGGKTAEELGLIMRRESQLPILPGTRDRTITIPGRHGKYDFGADMDARIFSLECVFVNAVSASDLQAKVRELADHLIDDNGQPRKLELVFDLEPDKKYMVRYAGSLPIERIAKIGIFTLPLIAYDPFARADIGAYDVVRQYDTGLQYNTGLIYPNPTSFDWLVKCQVMSQMNYGHVKVGPIITITGACTNPNIKNETTGDILTWAGTLSAGDVLEVNMEQMTVKLNNANAMSGVSGDFWKLAVGGNALAFESNAVPDAVVQIGYDHLFL